MRSYGADVTEVRHTLRSRPWLAAIVLAAALLLRVLVPAGFMPATVEGRTVLTLCTGVAPPAPMAAMPGMAHHGDVDHAARSPCAYADLALPAIGAADPGLVAVALAFAFVLALLHAVAAPVRATARLRPPLRGPPVAV